MVVQLSDAAALWYTPDEFAVKEFNRTGALLIERQGALNEARTDNCSGIGSRRRAAQAASRLLHSREIYLLQTVEAVSEEHWQKLGQWGTAQSMSSAHGYQACVMYYPRCEVTVEVSRASHLGPIVRPAGINKGDEKGGIIHYEDIVADDIVRINASEGDIVCVHARAVHRWITSRDGRVPNALHLIGDDAVATTRPWKTSPELPMDSFAPVQNLGLTRLWSPCDLVIHP